MTLISKEPEGVGIRSLIYDMKEALQKTNATEYPIFAVEEIPEERFCYFKRKGYYSLGE